MSKKRHKSRELWCNLCCDNGGRRTQILWALSHAFIQGVSSIEEAFFCSNRYVKRTNYKNTAPNSHKKASLVRYSRHSNSNLSTAWLQGLLGNKNMFLLFAASSSVKMTISRRSSVESDHVPPFFSLLFWECSHHQVWLHEAHHPDGVLLTVRKLRAECINQFTAESRICCQCWQWWWCQS